MTGANIISGKNIFGVDGSAPAFPSDCTTGNDGNCYINAVSKSALDGGLASGNIKSGVTIFGFTGSVVEMNPATQCINTQTHTTGCLNGASVSQTCTAFCTAKGLICSGQLRIDGCGWNLNVCQWGAGVGWGAQWDTGNCDEDACTAGNYCKSCICV